MQFQVISSNIRCGHPLTAKTRGVALTFFVFPSKDEQLQFSDGSRLMGCDLSENLGKPLTMGVLAKKLKSRGYEHIDENKFSPLSVTVSVTDDDWKAIDFLKDEEFACGFARYQNNNYAHNLQIWLSVEKDVFRDMLQVRLDMANRMTIDIQLRGLGDPNSSWPTWDLGDDSDCGKGGLRVVTSFSLGSETQHFVTDDQTELVEEVRSENKRDIEKIRSLLADIVAIGNGSIEGAVPKLLRLNLLATSVLAVSGLFALIRLYF